MEIPGWLVVLVVAGCLIIGVMIGQPYPVSLEEGERASFEQQIEDWKTYSEDVKEYQIGQCTIEKREMTDRLAKNNRDCWQTHKAMNEKWQQVFEDLNKTISTGFEDINAAIVDTNGC